ncbi:tyrosine-type recombinase/integrase [Lentisphaerota bacterium WC36G]|nr:tyrosine-type recombinase/integrase [Lentisphaerae bacterium WC36]
MPEKVKQYKSGTKHAGKSLNHIFKKMLIAIGIKDKSFHCFRHRFVDKLRTAGFSDEQIGSVVGHSSIQQTKDYGDYYNVIDLQKTF